MDTLMLMIIAMLCAVNVAALVLIAIITWRAIREPSLIQQMVNMHEEKWK